MFRFHKTLDVITLFHSPTVPASTKVLQLLKRASAVAAEHSTEANHDTSKQNLSTLKTEFELNATEEQPTADQLRSILDYVGPERAGEIVKGATGPQDALKKWKADQNAFQRPVTVDWNNGKAVAGDNESKILQMLRELPH